MRTLLPTLLFLLVSITANTLLLSSPAVAQLLGPSTFDDAMFSLNSPLEAAPESSKKNSDFVSGLRDGFESFPRQIGSPLYFEDPFINTDLRFILLYHEFPKGSLMGGGELMVQAIQARLAITDRLQFTATGDGYSDLEASALPQGDGWNDLAAGLKYAFYVDKSKMAIASVGARWRLSNGSRDLFQGIEDELSLYVTAAKKYDKLHLIGDLVSRFSTGSEGNDILSWDLNASYEVCKNFFPLLEYHGLYYMANGDRLNVRDGLLDYGNLGAGDVKGSSAHWATFGFRWNFDEGYSWGAGYGVPLLRQGKNDIFKNRFTTNLIITF